MKVDSFSDAEVKKTLEKELGCSLAFMVKSPGRVNLIGEHTDYNFGLSLPSAIDQFIFIGFAKVGDVDLDCEGNGFELEVVAVDYAERFLVRKIEKKEGTIWVNYVLGVIDKLTQHNGGLTGKIKIAITGNLGIGLGISSSAALCCGVAYGMNHLLGLSLSRQELALAAQWAEHNYIGTKCGLLDQTAVLCSEESSLIKVDFLTGEKSLHQVPFPLSIILLHSGEYHSLSQTCYNQRVAECKEAANIILKAAGKEDSNEPNLRNCELADLDKAKNQLTQKLYNRARYVIEENKRVSSILENIADKNFDGIRHAMNQTHLGLSSLYEVSTQRLDFLAEQANLLAEESFGSRLMGGGFGGCTINLVFPAKKTEFISKMTAIFKETFNEDLRVIEVSLSKGVHHIDY